MCGLKGLGYTFDFKMLPGIEVKVVDQYFPTYIPLVCQLYRTMPTAANTPPASAARFSKKSPAAPVGIDVADSVALD